MFNAAINRTVLSTLAAAIMASTLSINPAMAGGGGGGRDPGEGVSTISSTDKSGTTTTVKSKNREDTYTVTTTDKKGKVVKVERKAKKQKPFVTLHNADGTSTTIREVKKLKTFVTLHNADGTSTTITAADR